MKGLSDLLYDMPAKVGTIEDLTFKPGVRYDALTIVRQVWQQKVPGHIRQHARPGGVQDNVLIIETANNAVSGELRMRQPEILAAINVLLAEYSRKQIEKVVFRFSIELKDVRSEEPPLEANPLFSRVNCDCPKCGVPAKQVEIDRWKMCVFCFGQVSTNSKELHDARNAQPED